MAARTFRSNDTTAAARTWPRDLYGLIEAGERQTDRLAVCVPHRGRHIFYCDGCHMLPPHQRPTRRYRRQTDPAPTVRVQIEGDGLADAIAAAVTDALRPSRGGAR